ncbi:DNA cytosine methyltransferase [Blastococcus tunisiensis]|uniref:DNA (cytosine-5-)-methyltransferase n=1 Tax=Blastococcus tunisiensis TaxID=1798228 RepID=A0A1I2B870_9ACTN|nr:DNA (cytosine-5-)-methyltransferase [Blastococcus sp. DSM 46838]SFE52402.1 DNA (cytosine-5)-methyltransferase 1 [Blastococcus sp. DSM 46838]
MTHSILGLFAGIGGMELGLQQAGIDEPSELYEWWPSARSVLAAHFEDADLNGDVICLRDLHDATIVTAGFPCTDLSQAGRTSGLEGLASGLIRHVLQLLQTSHPEWVLIENVPNMLRLGRGAAIREITASLESAGYAWAYRTIDSRSFGLPQRRKRVYLLASAVHDPAAVLFRDDAPSEEPDGAASGAARDSAYGFYWTEGNRGVGWAIDAVPTLKGSTTVSIPSPPAVWMCANEPGMRIVRPSIEAAEVLQGFPAGWTANAPTRDRWKLVGNAVSVPVARWIGEGLLASDAPAATLGATPHVDGSVWPKAACHVGGKTWEVGVSEWPRYPAPGYQHLADVLRTHGQEPLSHRATKGFRDRLRRSSLRYSPHFMSALDEHVALSAP